MLDDAGLGMFVRFAKHFTRETRLFGSSAPLELLSTTTMAQQTTLDEWAKDPLVDPEIRAHVYSLITAVSFPRI